MTITRHSIEIFDNHPRYYDALYFFKNECGLYWEYIQDGTGLGMRLIFDNEEDKVEFCLRWL